jgi:hypothetical protein
MEDKSVTNQMKFRDVVAAIRLCFNDNLPNGWQLGWDESRLYDAVAKVAYPKVTRNYTTFDYNYCNWLEIRCGDPSDGEYSTLTIKISFIVPLFRLHWTLRSGVNYATIIDSAPIDCQPIEDKVRTILQNAGVQEIPEEWCNHVLADIELELSGTENVTVSKCLFSDYEG